MKTHTNNFKNEIKLYGKQLDSKIIYPSLSGTVELGVNELNSITPHYEGGILKSVMRGLTIDSNVEIPKGTMLNYQFGVLVNGSFEYINYGNYIVDTVEKQEDTNSYLIECCDSMLYAMKDYEAPNITYPITVRSYINAICNKIGLTFKNASDTFANYDKEIPSELYSDIGYTYRNVLDELAQVTASTICINEVDDELEIRYINDTNDTIDEEYLKDVNVNFGEKYGPVNSIVLTRAGSSDSVYLQDEESIEENGLCELKIEDNQIMNLNDRADYLPDILEVLDGFEYYTNDFSSTGICYYNLCDRYNVQVGENTYSCIMFNDEVDITQGLEEFIHTDMPEESETEYKYASKDDRQRNQAYIIAKKNEAEIQALASKIVDISNTISGVGQIQLENAHEGILHRLEITGNISVLYPSDDLYPSNDLYPRICNLLVDETLYDLDFEYLNYINDNVCDKYVYEDGKQWVGGNVSIDEYGEKYALSETVIEQGEDINIYVEKESNISMPAFGNAKFKCDYLLENEYTSTFANQVEVTSELNLLGDTLEAKVSQVADDNGNVTSASIILAVNNDESQAVINADKISLEGKEINLTSDDIIIQSTNFNVDKDGNVIMKNSIIELDDEDGDKLATLDDQGMKFYKDNQELIRMGTAIIQEQDPIQGQIEYNSAMTRIKDGQSIDWWRENPMNPGNYLPVLGFYNNDLMSGLAIKVPLIVNAGMQFNGNITGAFRFNDIDNAGVVTTETALNSNLYVSKLTHNGTGGLVFRTFIGDITIQGSISDERLKKNIKPSKTKALDKINQIEHVEFDWEENNEHVKNGYIAQQLNDIDEDLVIKNTDEKGLYQVHVLNLLAMTTKAIQEQQEEIDLLKQEIKLLKERIDK